MITDKTINKLYDEQDGCCAWCGRKFTSMNPMHVHHAIYARKKRFANWLDMPENLVALCSRCHLDNHGFMTSWRMRRHWWWYKIRLGYKMDEWSESIPMIIKDNFYDLTNEK